MAVCGWCGAELDYWWGKRGRAREYCNPSHRQSAYFARLTEEQRAAQLARKAESRSTKEAPA